MLAGPETRTVDGAVFAESHMARLLGEDTVLVDVGLGPAARRGRASSRLPPTLGVDLLVFVDVGGDVLGDRDRARAREPAVRRGDARRGRAAAATRRCECWRRSSARAATVS